MSNLKNVFDELTMQNITPILDDNYIITNGIIPSNQSYICSTLNDLDSVFEQIVEDGSVEINYKFNCDIDILKNIFDKCGFSFLIKGENLTLFLSDTDLTDACLEDCNILYETMIEKECCEEESEEDKSEEEESEEEESEEDDEKSEDESEEEKSEDESEEEKSEVEYNSD